MRYLNKLLFGKMENRHIIVSALGVPADTEELIEEAAAYPHIAIKDDVIYIWSVAEQEWIPYVPDALVSYLTLTADGYYVLPFPYMVWKIVFYTSSACTMKIGLTEGGDEIMMAKDLLAGARDSVTYDVLTLGADRAIYFSGLTGLSIFAIHKLKQPEL